MHLPEKVRKAGAERGGQVDAFSALLIPIFCGMYLPIVLSILVQPLFFF